MHLRPYPSKQDACVHVLRRVMPEQGRDKGKRQGSALGSNKLTLQMLDHRQEPRNATCTRSLDFPKNNHRPSKLTPMDGQGRQH
jgi:hypothetical protein